MHELPALARQEPEIFRDDPIWRISEIVWSGYLQKMYGKPGSIIRIRPTEVDRILEFLVYDSKVRKMGPHREAWRTQRGKLVQVFRRTHPRRYDELFGKP